MIEGHLKLYKSLADHKVKYLLIGGAAVIIYGVPRSTLDIDLFIKNTTANVKRLHDALIDAGFGTANLTTPEKISRNEVSVFNDFIRLDILTNPKSLVFEKAWPNRKTVKIKGIPVKLASIDDIISCKKSVGRNTDIEDIKILKRIKKLVNSA